MTEEQVTGLIAAIAPCDRQAEQAARARLDALAKPPGSLGQLEEIAARLAGITGQVHSTLDRRRVIVLAADNGVTAEGVSAAPQSVTAAQTLNILEGVTGVGVLAKLFHSELTVIDVGVDAELSHPALVKRKIRRSTGNIVREPAMTREEMLGAVEVGVSAAMTAAQDGCRVIGVGEMGIGNTTTSTAVLAGLLGTPEQELHTLCGRGAGLTDAAYAHKVAVIRDALAFHHPDGADALDVLAKVGGLDLAAMTGVYLGAARWRLPVVVDGFISVVAALCAARLCPLVTDYLFASHRSHEPGYTLAAQALGITPCLELDMRLGEGSGCPLMFAVMDAACAVIGNMTTLDGGRIDPAYLDNLRG